LWFPGPGGGFGVWFSAGLKSTIRPHDKAVLLSLYTRAVDTVTKGQAADQHIKELEHADDVLREIN
jgi:hypothetical protein